jgi:hypothetical protein
MWRPFRFLFVKTLKKPWSVAETPYPKRAVRLPAILSQDAAPLAVKVQ